MSTNIPDAMTMAEAINCGTIPPYGMGTQVQAFAFRCVSVWRYDKEKGKPPMWWVVEMIDNGRIDRVYPCKTGEDANAKYEEIRKQHQGGA